MTVHRVVLAALLILLPSMLGGASSQIPPLGCLVGPGDGSCTFDCPPNVVISAVISGGRGGADVVVECAGKSAACTAPSVGDCSVTTKTPGGTQGSCQLNDHDDPSPAPGDGDEDAHGWCGPLSVLTAAPGSPTSCDPEPVHTYHTAATPDPRVTFVGQGRGLVEVEDGNVATCNVNGNAFDGDYERGTNGAFFGWGVWASGPPCNYGLNVHGGNVLVEDLVFGQALDFVIGEDDRNGPDFILHPITGEVTACVTSGIIAPLVDPDDCISPIYQGTGATCGTGGGDGGFWVLLLDPRATHDSGLIVSNVPTRGTITAF